MKSSVGISKSCHSRHHTKYVVGPREDVESRVTSNVELESVVLSERISEVDGQDGRVDTRQVSGTRRLVLLGADGERVNVDTISRSSGVVVVGLVVVEVATLHDIKSVVTVELDLGSGNRVTSSVESQTVVALSDSDVLVDSVSGRVSRSVVDLEVLNRHRQVGEVEGVSDLNSVDGDRVKGTVGVGDHNVGALDEVRKLNTVVVSEEREVKRGEQSVVSVDTDVGLVDVIDALTIGKSSDVVVSQLNSDSLTVVEARVVDLRAQVHILSVDRTGVLGQAIGVDEDGTLSQVSGSVVNSLGEPEVVIVGVAQELTTATRERVSVSLAVEGTDLEGPDELLGRVVEVKSVLLVRRSGVGIDLHGLLLILNLLNEVLVTQLGVLASLTRLKVDVVNHDTGISEGEVAQVRGRGTGPDKKLGSLLELELDSDLMVLQGDQRQSQTVVSAEPELERNVQDSLREQDLSGVIEELLTAQGSKLRGVTDQLSVSALSGLVVGELPKDVEPDTEVLIDGHTTDLDLDLLEQSVSDTSDPSDLLGTGSEDIRSDGRNTDTKSSLGSKITLTEHLNRVSTARSSRVDRELDGLHSEVSVSSVDHLEVRNLRVARKIDILSTVCDEGNYTASHDRVLYCIGRKILLYVKIRQISTTICTYLYVI